MTHHVLSAKAPAGILSRLEASGVPVDSSGHRVAAYSYDASNYRVPPIAVVFPRTMDDVLKVITACRQTETPLTSRGGGTSMAGNAIGPGIVLDFSRHMNRILSIDEASRTADVEAGVILSHLTRETEKATGGNLTFAPDPSSKNRATIRGDPSATTPAETTPYATAGPRTTSRKLTSSPSTAHSSLPPPPACAPRTPRTHSPYRAPLNSVKNSSNSPRITWRHSGSNLAVSSARSPATTWPTYCPKTV